MATPITAPRDAAKKAAMERSIKAFRDNCQAIEREQYRRLNRKERRALEREISKAERNDYS